ncbi:purple acid phosphatase 18 [Tanacetum coccineum]
MATSVDSLEYDFLKQSLQWPQNSVEDSKINSMENAYEESGSTSNLYYSFEVAGAHVVMLGSYTDYDENSDQYNWLKASLFQL